MSQKNLRKIWLACAMILLVTSMDFLAASQSWGVNFGTKLFLEFKLSEWDAVETSNRAFTFILPLFLLVAILANTHARRQPGSPASKVPFRLMDISPDTKDGKRVQLLAAALFFVFPLICLIHFSRKILNYGCVFIKEDHTKTCLSGGIWHTEHLDWRLWDDTIRIYHSGATSNGDTFEPVVQPILILAVIAILLVLLLQFLKNVFEKNTTDPSAE